jgi:prepilin-type N-terminal cleavage/methylation domain-containing protein
MQKYWQKRYDRMHGIEGDRGFTLIELLVVILILGILAAVVVFSVGGITDNGKKSACKADAKTVETASEAYKAQNSASNAPALHLWNPADHATDLSKFVNDLDQKVANPANVADSFTESGGTVTYTPATGAVTNTCA